MINDNLNNEIDMKGQIVLITGANSGIGKETAKVLAEKGASVVMLCRNLERGEATLKELKEITNSDKIDLIIGDLADPMSIHNAAEQFKRNYDRLDILINNAGLLAGKREIMPSGYEKTFMVNHVGHFLLTQLLLGKIIESAPSRIINVSSEAHRFSSLNLDDINMNSNYNSFRAYSNSKLANILFTYELARKLEGTGVTVNALHPGFVRTNFGSGGISRFVKPFFKFAYLFGISAEKGAQTSVYLASSPEVKSITGKYFIKSKMAKSSRESYDLDSQKRLWELSMEIFNRETSSNALNGIELIYESIK